MSGLEFAKELSEKINQLGGDVKTTDPDWIKRAKSALFLFGVTAETLGRLGVDEEHENTAIKHLRRSYGAIMDGIIPPEFSKTDG